MITSIRNLIVRLRNDERGLTAVEYAVLGGIIVAALVSIGANFTTELTDAFNDLIP
jgi:pilus assembly protein Flp/PilA